MTTNCPVEATLELIGGKYKALILWHLSGRTLRFNELQKAIPSVTPRVLTHQLRELEQDGLVTRTVYPEVPPRVEYALSDLGESMRPIIKSMEAFGINYKEQFEK